MGWGEEATKWILGAAVGALIVKEVESHEKLAKAWETENQKREILSIREKNANELEQTKEKRKRLRAKRMKIEKEAVTAMVQQAMQYI